MGEGLPKVGESKQVWLERAQAAVNGRSVEEASQLLSEIGDRFVDPLNGIIHQLHASPQKKLAMLVKEVSRSIPSIFGPARFTGNTNMKVEVIKRAMIENSDYEDVQIDYYTRLLKDFLRKKEAGDLQKISVDIISRNIKFLTDMDASDRARYIVDLAELNQDLDLANAAKDISVAVLEMNGGVGSSMGLDPSMKQSKANGITLEASIGGELSSISVMEAKLRHYVWLKERFRDLHVIPLNGSSTDKGWTDFLGASVADSGAKQNGVANKKAFFEKSGLKIHESVVQQGFPLLDPATLKPIKSDNPDRKVAPGGHGQFLYHLCLSGKLRELSNSGVQVLVMTNSDNINATPNPQIAAAMLRDDIMAGLVTTDRTAIDAKGGIFAVMPSADDEPRLNIIEKAQVSEGQQKLFQSIGLRGEDKPQPFNTNTVYVNIQMLLDHLEELEETEGIDAVESLLMPQTIKSSKSFTHTVNGVEQKVKGAVHLEGAIASVVLKLPNVKLFNASVHDRTTEFTPLKTPVDAVLLLDSDVFSYDPERHQLVKVDGKAMPQFQLGGWDGWKDVNRTREVFGEPSFKDLRSLSMEGEVNAPGIRWMGDVQIINKSDKPLDLSDVEELSNVSVESDGMVIRVTSTATDAFFRGFFPLEYNFMNLLLAVR